MKITNTMLKEYLDLKQEQKRIEARLLEIKSEIIEQGGCQTQDYVAGIRVQPRRVLASIETFEDLLGEFYMTRNNLVNTIQVTYVDVVKRPNRP
jgi:phage host-nuclease inhibitor protein Gam